MDGKEEKDLINERTEDGSSVETSSSNEEEEGETSSKVFGTSYVRLSKAEKKLMKAQKLKIKRKAQLQEYKKRKKLKTKNVISVEDQGDVGNPKDSRAESIQRLRNALTGGLNVCIDLSYQDIHVERELSSLSRQISVAYGFLKKYSNPIHLHLCSLVPGSSLYVKLQQQGFESWIVDRHNKLPWQVFPINQLVMLTPDATEVLEVFEENKVYVIGGIVDRSVKKAQTLSKAQELGIITRRFPIQEMIPDRVCHILNVDHCIEIVTRFHETKSWEEVLRSVVPQRKQFKKEK